MKLAQQESIDAAALSTVTQPLPEQNNRTREVAAVLRLVTGRWTADIVGVAAELRLADQLQSGPRTAEEIAAAMGLHAPSLYRLLRALANFGIFAKQEDGGFAQTPMSDTLRSDVPYSMRSFAVEVGTAMANAYNLSSVGTLADIGESQALMLSFVVANRGPVWFVESMFPRYLFARFDAGGNQAG
jgi:DNA-binding HxlR family transcriptional regulator